MKLAINALLTWEQDTVFRVLWLSQQDVVLIDVNNAKAVPEIHSQQILEEAFANHRLRLETFDPHAPEGRSEEQLTEAERTRRDRAWTVIRPLVEDHLPDIFLKEKRGQLVTNRVHEVGVSKTTCYGYLRRYWQGGQTPNALLPNYKASGAPGEARVDRGNKRGRPGSNT